MVGGGQVEGRMEWLSDPATAAKFKTSPFIMQACVHARTRARAHARVRSYSCMGVGVRGRAGVCVRVLAIVRVY
jgi:hypothetical protein